MDMQHSMLRYTDTLQLFYIRIKAAIKHNTAGICDSHVMFGQKSTSTQFKYLQYQYQFKAILTIQIVQGVKKNKNAFQANCLISSFIFGLVQD